MEVFVLTDPELGWDCVLGVYTSERDAMLSMLVNYISDIDFDSLSDEEIITMWNEKRDGRYIIGSYMLQ